MPPPKKRAKINDGLPRRWRYKNGAYRYRVPKGQEAAWDDRSEFTLGQTLPEAHRTWAGRMDTFAGKNTLADLLDRYAIEVLPEKAPKTRKEQAPQIRRLRAVFGALPVAKGDKVCWLEPHHAYTYYDKRKAKTAAKREMEILSHALTKAVEWGYIRRNPLIKGFTVRGRTQSRAARYIEDWEIVEALSLEPRRKKGSVAMCQAYTRLKLLTGLRMTDMLLLRVQDFRPDGIHVTPHKTAGSSGVRRIIERSTEIEGAWQDCLSVRPVHIGPYLFCNRRGEPYFNEAKGTANGFESIWQRFMKRVLAETQLQERFRERDLRAKAGTDAESLEHAKALLAHVDERTTRRWYRRKPEVVSPGRGVKSE